jgi:uncharacterized protein (TIGR02145 family)
MKLTRCLLAALSFFVSPVLFAQPGMTIHPGASLTVNGELVIIPHVFLCGDTIKDARDGQIYGTVKIGSQCWMKQNLNVGTKVEVAAEQANNHILEKYCFNGLESNCDVYGGLYQWAEMVQYLNGATNASNWNPVPSGNIRGICPTGWHIPTDAEWTALIDTLGGYWEAGGKLKEPGTVHWADPNEGATNETGFTALGAGARFYEGTYYYLRGFTYFWTATHYGQNVAWHYNLLNFAPNANRDYKMRTDGFSVRCLKD